MSHIFGNRSRNRRLSEAGGRKEASVHERAMASAMEEVFLHGYVDSVTDEKIRVRYHTVVGQSAFEAAIRAKTPTQKVILGTDERYYDNTMDEKNKLVTFSLSSNLTRRNEQLKWRKKGDIYVKVVGEGVSTLRGFTKFVGRKLGKIHPDKVVRKTRRVQMVRVSWKRGWKGCLDD